MAAIATLAPPKARIDHVLNALGIMITFAINSSNIRSKTRVMVGKPLSEDVKRDLATGGSYVYIFPQTGRLLPNLARLTLYQKFFPQVTLEAQVQGNEIVFSGQPQSGVSVHIAVNRPAVPINYKTVDGDTTLATIANNVAAACTAAGFEASVFGSTVTLPANINWLTCNVTGTGSIQRESDRFEQRVDVRVLAPTPDKETNPLAGLRSAIGQAITTNVGTMNNQIQTLDDGSQIRIRKADVPRIIDKSMSDFAVFEFCFLYLVEYGILETTSATQVGSISHITKLGPPQIEQTTTQ